MKKLIFGLIILLACPPLLFAQITSTTVGGNWNETSTWIGGVVPTDTDDVVVDGNVIVNISTAKCKNLTVNSGDTLTKDNNARTLIVLGDLLNSNKLHI